LRLLLLEEYEADAADFDVFLSSFQIQTKETLRMYDRMFCNINSREHDQ
jgi:hypothetical protein